MMCLAIAASGLLSSCSEDMPNVNFVNVVTNSADFREVIAAINSQTKTLAQKLDLVNTTLKDTNTTLAQKLELIEAAVNNGVDSYENLAKKLIESINALNATQEAKLQAIYDIIKSNAATLEAKLADIEAAINAGIGTYKEYAEKLIESINAMNKTQAEKLQAICDILASNNATLAQKLADIEAAINAGIGTYEELAKALIASINALNLSQAEKLQAIYDILNSEFATLSQKVADVAAAIEAGFISDKAAIEALNKAIVDALADNSRDLNAKLADIKTAIEAINTSIGTGFTLERDALTALSTKLLEVIASNANSEAEKLNLLADAIEALTGNLEEADLALLDLLKQLKEAIEARTDYSGIIAAIRSLLPYPEAEYVDLGLSVKWAKWNVGAKSETDYGSYFAWGETTPKEDYNMDTYKWAKYDKDSGSYVMTKYNSTDGLKTLEPEDDAATANWGYDWRIPTWDECAELMDNCKWTWTTKNGVNGYTVTSKENGNSIFLPAAGCCIGADLENVGVSSSYWSLSLTEVSDSGTAYGIYFNSSLIGTLYGYRYYGNPIRPVLNK